MPGTPAIPNESRPPIRSTRRGGTAPNCKRCFGTLDLPRFGGRLRFWIHGIWFDGILSSFSGPSFGSAESIFPSRPARSRGCRVERQSRTAVLPALQSSPSLGGRSLKLPRVLMILRNERLRASTALIVVGRPPNRGKSTLRFRLDFLCERVDAVERFKPRVDVARVRRPRPTASARRDDRSARG
jgi:hypothetical protein